MIFVNDEKNYVLGDSRRAFKKFFKDELRDEKTLYTDMISGKTELYQEDGTIKRWIGLLNFSVLIQAIIKRCF